ncbi:MAG: PEP-CTERM sorting domain-containing protein [Deltaproteobacteria bacterium]|nr:PEP-CTERM sorting domain-containing protein [Deltaproteobacteria bacterium]MBZ0218875.1 PEP-CTERM sorting domain-containing protein [Deltaproteobacteria bacterium]
MKRSLLSAAVLAGCLALVPAVSSANASNNGPTPPPFNGNGGNTNTNVAVATATNTTIVKIKNIIKVNGGKKHFKPVRNNVKDPLANNGSNYNGGKHYNGKKCKKENNNNHAVPEPGTMALLAAAMGAIVIRKRQSAK